MNYSIEEVRKNISKQWLLDNLPFTITFHDTELAQVVKIGEALEPQIIIQNIKKDPTVYGTVDDGFYGASEAERLEPLHKLKTQDRANKIEEIKKKVRELPKKDDTSYCEHGFPKQLCKKCMFK